MKQLVVLGAGGHGKVVLDAAVSGSRPIWGLIDDDADKVGLEVLGYEVRSDVTSFLKMKAENIAVIVAVGANKRREKLHHKIPAHLKMGTVIHPAATISCSVKINVGTMIMAGAVINADTTVGAGVIINTNASIDHDCRLEDFVQVSPGATICGSVILGERSFVGAGATILQGLTVGSDAIVAAGAVVIEDVPAGSTVKGMPAV